MRVFFGGDIIPPPLRCSFLSWRKCFVFLRAPTFFGVGRARRFWRFEETQMDGLPPHRQGQGGPSAKSGWSEPPPPTVQLSRRLQHVLVGHVTCSLWEPCCRLYACLNWQVFLLCGSRTNAPSRVPTRVATCVGKIREKLKFCRQRENKKWQLNKETVDYFVFQLCGTHPKGVFLLGWESLAKHFLNAKKHHVRWRKHVWKKNKISWKVRRKNFRTEVGTPTKWWFWAPTEHTGAFEVGDHGNGWLSRQCVKSAALPGVWV